MTEQSDSHLGTRLLVIAAALVIIIAGIHQAQSVLVSFLVAVFLAMLGTPPVLWLERKHRPSVGAVLLVVAGMVLVRLGAGAIVGASVGSFYTEVPVYQARLQERASALWSFLANKGIRGMDKALLAYVNPAAVISLTAGLLSGVGSALSNIALVLLTTTFILFEASSFPVKLRAVLGDPRQVFPQFTKFVNDVERYVVIKTVISLATGILAGAWLSILGVDFPVLWGFLAFLLNYVPNVGSTIPSTTIWIFFEARNIGTSPVLVAWSTKHENDCSGPVPQISSPYTPPGVPSVSGPCRPCLVASNTIALFEMLWSSPASRSFLPTSLSLSAFTPFT